MNDRRLIECVRKRECLYNSDHPKYMDAKYKGIVWREIEEEVGQPAELCKSRWQNIRDSFRKSLRKSSVVLDTRNPSTYKYKDALEFLLPSINYQDTNPGLADSTGESSKANNEPPPSNDGVAESEQLPPPPPPMTPPPRKRSRCNLEEEETLKILENRITACTDTIEQLLQQHALSQREPALRLFFESVIMSVSRLKRRNQTIVQQGVLQIISEFQDTEEKEEAT